MAVGRRVMPAMGTQRVPCSITKSTNQRRSTTVSTGKRSAATTPEAWAWPNAAHEPSVRYGAGPIPALFKISQTVDAATLRPNPSNSPWILR